jgi:hypothetical protein
MPSITYVEDEIEFVEGLIAEGLDGYIVDPESDDGRIAMTGMMRSGGLGRPLLRRDQVGGAAKEPDFLFGTTSGCDYPVIKPKYPVDVPRLFDAVYPQIYWAPDYITQRTTPTPPGRSAWRRGRRLSLPVCRSIRSLEKLGTTRRMS